MPSPQSLSPASECPERRRGGAEPGAARKTRGNGTNLRYGRQATLRIAKGILQAHALLWHWLKRQSGKVPKSKLLTWYGSELGTS